jgi:uroporphyrinogen-III synthase
LRSRGFEPVALPLSEIVPLSAELPDRPVAGYVATSAAAIEVAGPSIDRTLPFFAVGTATASVAAEIGCSDVRTGPGDAAGLADIILRSDIAHGKGDLLYLAGRPRRPELESKLVDAGISLQVATVYEAKAIEPSREELLATSASGLLAALFYSQAASGRFAAAVEKHGLANDFAAVPMLGLSRQVVAPFEARSWARDSARPASAPDEESLLLLLAAIRNKAG